MRTPSPNGRRVRASGERNLFAVRRCGVPAHRARDLSEFGNWGLPILEKVLEAEGGEPYWFKTGDGPVRPEKVLERFAHQQLERAYANYDALAVASQEQEWISLKWEIEEMRRHSELAGYVITEFTDPELGVQRPASTWAATPRCSTIALAEVQAQDILIPRLNSRTALWAGERTTLSLAFSCFSGSVAAGGTISWSVEETITRSAAAHPDVHALTGVIPVSLDGEEPNFGTYGIGQIAFAAPAVETPAKVVLRLILRDAEGKVLARNTQAVVFLPAALRAFGQGTDLRLHDPLASTPDLASTLTSLGFVLGSADDAPILATRWGRRSGAAGAGRWQSAPAGKRTESLTLAGGLNFGLSDRDHNGWWGRLVLLENLVRPVRLPDASLDRSFRLRVQERRPETRHHRPLPGEHPLRAVLRLAARRRRPGSPPAHRQRPTGHLDLRPPAQPRHGSRRHRPAKRPVGHRDDINCQRDL